METHRLRPVFLRWDPNDVTHCRILPADKTTRWLVQTTLCRRWCHCLADQLWLLNAYTTTTTTRGQNCGQSAIALFEVCKTVLLQVMAQLFNITGCEASLESFYRTGLVNHCSEMAKHAMYLYHALKCLCRQQGHTYIRWSRLKREASDVHSNYRPSSNTRGSSTRPDAVDWGPALDFLEEWHVIVRESNGMHVYLHRYWYAEKKIAEAFHLLRSCHESEPWTFEIDTEKYVYVFASQHRFVTSEAVKVYQFGKIVFTRQRSCSFAEYWLIDWLSRV